VNKYFLLNNIRGERDGAMLAVHYTPRISLELDAKSRERKDVMTFLSEKLHFCR